MTVWTKDKIAKVRRLHSDGVKRAEIANELGVSYNAVCGITFKLGLKEAHGRVRHNAWSHEEDRILRLMWSEGEPTLDISDALKQRFRSANAIDKRAQLLGLKRPEGFAVAVGPSSGWSEERVAILARMWANGKSANDIAEELGGVSRNAVIGKVHRLGLQDRNSAGIRRERAARRTPTIGQRLFASKSGKKAVVDKPKIEREKIARAELAEIETVKHVDDVVRKALVDLEPDDCRWPIGDPRRETFGFCALEKVPGTSYCAGHLHRSRNNPVVPQRGVLEPTETSSETPLKIMEPA